MSFVVSKEDKTLYIKISDIFSIYHVNTARKDILDVLSDVETVSIDSSELNEIDTAGIQLLISLAKTIDTRNIELHLKGNKNFLLYLNQTGKNISEFLFKGDNVENSSDR